MTYQRKKWIYPGTLVVILTVLIVTMPVAACDTPPSTCHPSQPPRVGSIVLTPESATAHLFDGTTQVFTATVLDQSGQPMPNLLVMFTTDFGHFDAGNRLTGLKTDDSGQAQVTIVSSSVGTATITAWIDANGDHVWNPGEPSDTATMTWLAPASAPGFTCPTGSYSLVTSDGTTAGCVAVSNDDVNLYVGFTSSPSDPLVTADWAWAFFPANIPQTNGVPDPSLFPFTYAFQPCELSYQFPGFDISPVIQSDVGFLILSAHGRTQSGKDAWVLSDTFVDANGAKAKYFAYNIQPFLTG